MGNEKKILFLALIILFSSCKPDNISIITYNIRFHTESDGENAWPYRRNFLVEQIKFYDPDILGIQEGLPNQVTYLAGELNAYDFVGIGRDGEVGGEHSSIFFKKDRFDILVQNTFWLSETPDTVSLGWDAVCRRICTYAQLFDNYNNQKFWVFNTHLDHKGLIARIESVKLIFEKIDEVIENNDLVLLIGDFNDTPESELIKLTEQEFINCEDISNHISFGPCGTYNGFNFHDPVVKKIDYIFIKNPSKCNVIKHAVLSDSKDCKYPSDHLPVYAELGFD
jgi:endonuclease/exonuclease/phosphatase family metal-dependent hydrolase